MRQGKRRNKTARKVKGGQQRRRKEDKRRGGDVTEGKVGSEERRRER